MRGSPLLELDRTSTTHQGWAHHHGIGCTRSPTHDAPYGNLRSQAAAQHSHMRVASLYCAVAFTRSWRVMLWHAEFKQNASPSWLSHCRAVRYRALQAPTHRFRWRTAACCRWPTRLPRSAAATWWVCGSSGSSHQRRLPPSAPACTTANMESVFSTVFPPLVNALHARLPARTRQGMDPWAYGKWRCKSWAAHAKPKATAGNCRNHRHHSHGDRPFAAFPARLAGPVFARFISLNPFPEKNRNMLAVAPLSAQRAFARELRRECRLRFIQAWTMPGRPPLRPCPGSFERQIRVVSAPSLFSTITKSQ